MSTTEATNPGSETGSTPSAVEGMAIPILTARDLDATVNLFEQLGFTATRYRVEGYAILRRGGIELHYTSAPNHDPWISVGAAFIRLDDADRFFAEIRDSGLVPVVSMPHNADQVAALRRTWEEGGSLARMTEPADRPWGMREFSFLDPSNNLLRLGHRLT